MKKALVIEIILLFIGASVVSGFDLTNSVINQVNLHIGMVSEVVFNRRTQNITLFS